jgi:hypothetical protein
MAVENSDDERKSTRLSQMAEWVEQEFGKYEILPENWVHSRWNWAAEAAMAIERDSPNPPRAVIGFSREILTDQGIPWESAFRRGIQMAKAHLKQGEGVKGFLITTKDIIQL